MGLLKKKDVTFTATPEEPNTIDTYTPIKTNPFICILGCILGTLPGIGLWLLLSYLNFSSGIMGFVIVGGSLVTYKKFNKKAVNIFSFFSIVFSVFVIFILTTSIEATSLRKSYNEIINDDESIASVREQMIELYKNNGNTEEQNLLRLQLQYNITGYDDIEGFNKVVKDALRDKYMESHSFPTAPDSFVNSYKCVLNYLVNDSEYSKSFFTDLIVGLAFAVLAYALITNSTFMSNEED